MVKGVDEVPLLDSYTAQLLGAMQQVTIQQKVDMMEAVLTNTIGCGEQANKYRVFDTATGYPLFHVEEFSTSGCVRCCCAPDHPFFLKFFALNPDGSTNTSVPPLMTLEREGVCGEKCKCPSCFSFCECCRDQMILHAGDITEGAPGMIDPVKAIGCAKQPYGGGGFTPTLQVMERDSKGLSEEPLSVAEGPCCCIGGCLAMCCDFNFSISNVPTDGSYNGQVLRIGDLAQIEKKKPHDFGSAFREMLTDADTYTVTFIDKTLAPQQKATILGTVLLMDYMFFENDNDMIHCDPFNQTLTITPCVCYCFGCLCPCSFTLGGKDSSNN